MIISIASGKGGTGKTTVATNLALSMQEMDGVAGTFNFLDCDVEEPNAHFFLQPEMELTRSVSTFVPEIDEEKCTHCKACATICRYSAIAVAGKKTLVFPELCHSCGGCQLVCEAGAVREGSRPLGSVAFGKIRSTTQSYDIPFYSGKMRVGEAMAPPLIKAVRKHETEAQCTIIDAPPGTSCPVITAMRNTDFVLMVTEPTPFGLHDLQLAVEAVKVLGIPAGLVINRADLGDDNVKKYAQEQGLEILMEIPFTREFAVAYSQGQTIVAVSPEWQKKFQALYLRIEEIVQKRGMQ